MQPQTTHIYGQNLLFCLQRQDDDYRRVLDDEAKKRDALKRRAKAADQKDQEIAVLQKQLAELQVRASSAWLSY